MTMAGDNGGGGGEGVKVKASDGGQSMLSKRR